MKRKRIEIEKSKLLLVEGRSCQVFFQALLEEMGLDGQIQVHDFGGVDELRQGLLGVVQASGFPEDLSTIGIVRDAERDPRSAFRRVCSALGHFDLAQPTVPLAIAQGNPNVAALILPDPATPGMLEDLCLRAVADDPAMRCVDGYFDCLTEVGSEPRIEAKGRVQAFLASRKEDCPHLGQAAVKGYWPWGSPAFDQVKGFLQSL